MAEVDPWIGQRGYWIDDNEYCEVFAAIDSGAGVYEFRSLDAVAPTDHPYWIGFIEDFFPE